MRTNFTDPIPFCVVFAEAGPLFFAKAREALPSKRTNFVIIVGKMGTKQPVFCFF